MTFDAIVFWLFVALWVILGLDLVEIIVPRIVYEVRGMIRRIGKLVGGGDLFERLAVAEADVDRILGAVRRGSLLLASLRRRDLMTPPSSTTTRDMPGRLSPAPRETEDLRRLTRR